MKKLLASLAILLALHGPAMAALISENGTYLNKDGSLVTEEQVRPPEIMGNALLPMNKMVLNALKELPHKVTTVLEFTVDEDGAVSHVKVRQSSGSLVLDRYAADSVETWSFIPARINGRTITSTAQQPINFQSAREEIPASPVNQEMKPMSDEVREAAERNHHPAIRVEVFLSAEGKQEKKPSAIRTDASMSYKDWKILASYAEDCVKKWTFTPARNPDGETIGADTVVDVQL